jgi:hypothetical protein
MTGKTINHLFLESFAVGVVAFYSPSQVNARAYVEPVRCQQSAPCVCKPLESQAWMKYWDCKWDARALIGPAITLAR